MSAVTALVVAFLLLLGNAFFVAAEFALVSARRTQIEPRAEAGSRMARTTLKAMENIFPVIGVAQLGITVCSLVLGAVGEPAVAHLIEPVLHAVHVPDAFLHPVAFAVGLSIIVYLHVVMGEMIPKNIALAGPDRVALLLGPVIWGIYRVVKPFASAINATASAILLIFGVRLMSEVSSTYTREEVAALVEESRGEGLLGDHEYDRLSGALDFTEKTVASVLMPPDTVTTVRRGASQADVEALCARHRLQPVPGGVRRRRADRLPPHQGRSGARRAAVATTPSTTRWSARSRRCRSATRCMPPSRRSNAGVRTWRGWWTPPGRRSGLATLEDVIEELVGEIRDAAHLEESL